MKSLAPLAPSHLSRVQWDQICQKCFHQVACWDCLLLQEQVISLTGRTSKRRRAKPEIFVGAMTLKDEQVTLRLIFVNYNSTSEVTVSVALRISELKKLILSSRLPENFVDLGDIDHIRLLNAGKELDDKVSIGDAHIQLPGGSVIPVHVVTVLKSALAAANGKGADSSDASKGKLQSCWCTIC